MKRKLVKIGIWILIWVVFSIGFMEYLPQHVHMPFSVLISPLLLPFIWFTALFYPSELAVDPFSLDIIFGAVFWIVFFVLLYFPRNQNRTKPEQ
jgi:hypothetical protein